MTEWMNKWEQYKRIVTVKESQVNGFISVYKYFNTDFHDMNNWFIQIKLCRNKKGEGRKGEQGQYRAVNTESGVKFWINSSVIICPLY